MIKSPDDSEAEYKNVPFKRALAEIERGNFTGLLALSPGREKYLFTENSMGYFKNQFFVRADSTWKWDGRSSLEKVVFGGILGYRFDKEFIDPHVEKFKAMSLLVVERDLFPEKRTGMRREIEGYGSDQSICANQDSWEDNA